MATAMEQMKQFVAKSVISPASSSVASSQDRASVPPTVASTSAVPFVPPPNPLQTEAFRASASPQVVAPTFRRRASILNAPPPTSSVIPSPTKVVRHRPSLEEVLASRPSALKRRQSTDSLLSEEETSLGVVMQAGGGMQVDEDEDESIERTPSPYLGDAYHQQQQAGLASTEDERMEAVAESDRKTGGLLDNILGGDAQAKGDEQRRWKEHKDGKTPPIGGGGFVQHLQPVPVGSETSVYRLPSGLGGGGHSTSVEHQQFGLERPDAPAYYPTHFGDQHQRSGGFPRASSFNDAGSSSQHASTSYLHASASMHTSRTLSDPFLTKASRANPSSIHSSPTSAVVPSPYHAPPGLIKAGLSFAAQVSQSPRQEKDCFWSSSPSGPGVGSVRSSTGSMASGGISRPASRSSDRSSGEDEYATPGRTTQELPFVSDEGSSNSSHHGGEGSIYDSAEGEQLYAPHRAVAGSSRMGSLLQAGMMAAEHAGFSSLVKSERGAENDEDLYLPIGKRRGGMGMSDAGSESELEAEEDEAEVEQVAEGDELSANAKGKEREGTLSDSSASKKKGKGKKGGKGKKKSEKPVGEEGSPDAVREVDLPPQGLPPGPRPVDKPSYSYAGLIGQAILSHPDRKLSLNAIYDWIIAAYPFYTKSEPGWMNSIRHNLSLNICFVKRERDANGPVGKGNLWAIEEGAESQFANGGYKKKPGQTGKGGGKKTAVAQVAAADKAEPVSDAASNGSASKKRVRKPKKIGSDDEQEANKKPRVESLSQGAPPSPNSSPALADKKVAPLAAPPPKKQRKKKVVEPQGPAFTMDAFGPRPTKGVLPSARQSGLVYAPPPPPSAYRPQQHHHHAGGYYVEDDSVYATGRTSDGEDDFATPQRPRSRGPTGEGDSSKGGHVIPHPIASRGLPHLTPSVSSPVSSPGPPTMPRPNTQGARAHQKYIKSSLHEPENVRIREEEPEVEEDEGDYLKLEMPMSDDEASQQPIASGSLQPAFHIQPQASSSRSTAPVRPGSPHFTAGLSAGISLSPMSSVRGTAHGDEEDASRGPYGFPSSFGHHSPLQSRTRDPSGHRRMLSQTGSLIAHALKTPAMQPITSSPVGRGHQQHHPFDGSSHVPHSPLNRRVISYGASSTPKGIYSYPAAFGGGTPARTPFHPSMNQSPAGAALLSFHGDTLDPYNPSHGVEEALGQLSSSESPSGTPRTNGSAHWGLAMFSPGFGDSPQAHKH